MNNKEKYIHIKKKVMKGKRNFNQEEINFEELKKIKRENPNAILLDVRSPQEYKEGHLNGAILIPSYEIQKKASINLKDKKEIILVYCQSGSRSKKAVKDLKQLGYEQIYSLKGGLDKIK